jgi:N4-gp56 family major capsid protein
MATSANAFLSTAGSADYVNPTVWSEAIEQVARESVVMPNLSAAVLDNRAVGSAMEQINIAKNQAFTAAALTEGTATPVTTLAFDQVTVTFAEYGLAKQVGNLELAYGISGVFGDITSNMGMALAEKKDDVVIAALVAAPYTTKYADGVTSGSISAANVFNTDLIANGITAMRTVKRQPRELVIHPNQENALIKDTSFVDASIYGGREVVLNGEIGKYLGLRVISYSRVPSATENSVTVYKAMLLGARAFVVAQKIAPSIQWKEDSILDRAVTFSATEAYGVSVLNSESVILLKSV